MKKFRAYEHFGVTKLNDRKLKFVEPFDENRTVKVQLTLHPTYKELIQIQEQYSKLEFIGVE